MGILLSYSTLVNSLHFCQAILILFCTSCSHPPWALKVDPRYLNVSVCFSVFPIASLIVTVSGTLEHTIVSVLLMFTLSPLRSSVLCQSSKRFCIPVSVCSANARSSAYRGALCAGLYDVKCYYERIFTVSAKIQHSKLKESPQIPS